MIAEPPSRAKWVGSSVKRKEDPRLLTGDGHFVDDIQFANLKHAAILRSPHAHAHIRGIDTSKAEQLPGVLAVITGKDVEKIAAPFSHPGGAGEVGRQRHVHQGFFWPYLFYLLTSAGGR